MTPSIVNLYIMWSISSLLYFSVTTNVCRDGTGTSRCCTGYYLFEGKENKTCLECIGAIGINCSDHCNPGMYGKQCKSKCNCSESQCDRREGCPKDDGTQNSSSGLDFLKNMSRLHWLIVSIGVMLLLFVAICSAMTYVYMRNKKRNRLQRGTRSSTNRAYMTHTLPFEPTSVYDGFIWPQHASTEYLTASFESKPVDDSYEYI